MAVTAANPNPDPEPKADKDGKNIVLCFDGTGDWAGTNRTNVMEIFQCAAENANQKVFYYGGVGTLANAAALSPARKMFLKLLDLAVATSLRDSVLDGYTRLSNEYQEGDRIYLIGFSRGAFAARLVAAMVHVFGLLEKRNAHLAPYLWQAISNPEPFSDFMAQAARIKRNFARQDDPPVHIHFMGLFDTVSSVGIFERFKVFPYATKNPSVLKIRHAVSRDESRNAFPEQLVVRDNNDVFEVWFDGVHRDVGGGATEDQGYENITLDWMATEALKAQMVINREGLPSGDTKRIHLGGFDPYVLVGLYPQLMFDADLRRLDRINYSFARFWRSFKQVVPASLGTLLGRPWPEFSKPRNDPGFRYRWPNFKHFRKVPSNALQHVDADYKPGEPDNQRFAYTANVTGATKYYDNPGPLPPEPPRYPFSGHDFIGTFLGVTLAFLMANRMLGEPFGASWPGASGIGAFWIFVIFLVQQGFSQNIARTKFRFLNSLVPALGLGLAIWLGYWSIRENGRWYALEAGAIVGGVAVFLAQAPFLWSRAPFIRSDRAIPFFILPWFLAGLFLAVAELVWNFVAPPIASTTRWLFSWNLPEGVSSFLKTYGPVLLLGLGIASCLTFLALAGKRDPSAIAHAKKREKAVEEKNRAILGPIFGLCFWVVIAVIFSQREPVAAALSEFWEDIWRTPASFIDAKGLHPVFTPLAWLIAVIAAISGAVQIVQDRFKMLPPKEIPDH